MRIYKVFFVASSITPLRPFIELTKQLKEKVPILVYVLCDKQVEYRRIIKENNIECNEINFIELGDRVLAPESKTIESEEIKSRTNGKKLYNNLKKIYSVNASVKFMIDIKNIIQIICNERKKRSEIMALIEYYLPDLIICYSDLRMGYETQAIYCAAKYNIPCMLAPVVRYGKPETSVKNGMACWKKSINDKLSLVERICAKKYSQSLIRVDDVIAFRHVPQVIIANGIINSLPQNLWIPGTSTVTFVALTSEEEYEYNVKVMGKSYADKCEVTHTIEETYILMNIKNRQEMRRQIQEAYNINSAIVCLAFSGYADSTLPITYEQEKDIYLKVIEEIKSVFGVVFISLHPRMKKEKYIWVSKIKNCIVVDAPLYKIIPALDVLVGCEISSVNNMVRNINIPKISIANDIFMNGITDKDIEELRTRLFAIKNNAIGEFNLSYDDGREDFYKIVIKELQNSGKN